MGHTGSFLYKDNLYLVPDYANFGQTVLFIIPTSSFDSGILSYSYLDLGQVFIGPGFVSGNTAYLFPTQPGWSSASNTIMQAYIANGTACDACGQIVQVNLDTLVANYSGSITATGSLALLLSYGIDTPFGQWGNQGDVQDWKYLTAASAVADSSGTYGYFALGQMQERAGIVQISLSNFYDSSKTVLLVLGYTCIPRMPNGVLFQNVYTDGSGEAHFVSGGQAEVLINFALEDSSFSCSDVSYNDSLFYGGSIYFGGLASAGSSNNIGYVLAQQPFTSSGLPLATVSQGGQIINITYLSKVFRTGAVTTEVASAFNDGTYGYVLIMYERQLSGQRLVRFNLTSMDAGMDEQVLDLQSNFGHLPNYTYTMMWSQVTDTGTQTGTETETAAFLDGMADDKGNIYLTTSAAVLRFNPLDPGLVWN